MNTKQESKVKMYSASRDFLEPNAAITTPLPEFTQNFTVFQNTLNELRLIGEMQKDVRTGLAKDKKDMKNILISLSADNSRKVFAYAKNKEIRPLWIQSISAFLISRE